MLCSSPFVVFEYEHDRLLDEMEIQDLKIAKETEVAFTGQKKRQQIQNQRHIQRRGAVLFTKTRLAVR